MISAHSGYGVEPHLQIFYMIYMFYTVKKLCFSASPRLCSSALKATCKSPTISAHSGYGVKPHLQNLSLCSLWQELYMIYMFYTV